MKAATPDDIQKVLDHFKLRLSKTENTPSNLGRTPASLLADEINRQAGIITNCTEQEAAVLMFHHLRHAGDFFEYLAKDRGQFVNALISANMRAGVVTEHVGNAASAFVDVLFSVLETAEDQ